MNFELLCSACREPVERDSKYCPNCGEIFGDSLKCSASDGNPAAGVCVICGKPFCKKHGKKYYFVFLCDEHAEYETYQGMARVFGSSDFLEINYYKDCFEKAGLHPFVYERKTSPISLGGTDYSLFRASGEFDGHIINELKLMLPFREVLQAEIIISELEKEK